MQTTQINSAHEFLDGFGEQLIADEIRHSLMHGIAEQVSNNPHSYSITNPWFVVVEENGILCGAAICTPPYRVLLAHICGNMDEVVKELCEMIFSIDPSIPGVIGESVLADTFNEIWCKANHAKVEHIMNQRIYKLTDLLMPRLSQGYFRTAELKDEETIVSWLKAFHLELMGEDVLAANSQNFLERTHKRIQDGKLYLWVDDIPVSMAGSIRPTKNGVSIGAVYTPQQFRNNGYASTCVAMTCRELLKSYSFCVLYTDLSNPVSNSIYKRIGFKEYCDSAQYTYEKQK